MPFNKVNNNRTTTAVVSEIPWSKTLMAYHDVYDHAHACMTRECTSCHCDL